MKVSLKATYAILAALDIALHNGTMPVRAKSIAKRQAIPARFLEQVLNAMKRAGFVESSRGAQGGYTLRKPPADLSLAEIVQALDGSFAVHITQNKLRREESLEEIAQGKRKATGQFPKQMAEIPHRCFPLSRSWQHQTPA